MLIDPTKILIEDYNYSLPDEKIAKYPKQQRDASKLLIYKNGQISESIFSNVTDYLPNNANLIFNNSKVIPARLLFRKESGANIEIFCLEPLKPSADFAIALQQKAECQWRCMVGNLKKWKEGTLTKDILIDGEKIKLSVSRYKEDESENTFRVNFKWSPERFTFSQIIDNAGLVPLPPYIDREADSTDKLTYQTVYARHEGSVAAPTAGLHFTDNVINNLKNKGITPEYVTLHVGAGTFQPVSSHNIDGHKMHSEVISVEIETIKHLIENINKPTIAVGTTSLRTIESIYWLGVKLSRQKDKQHSDTILHIDQWKPYRQENNTVLSKPDALMAVFEYMQRHNLKSMIFSTGILIVPGYEFRLIDGLITNFHQPKSTLLLLIAAYIGNDWKRIYDYALKNDFRFLSYGDSSLILKTNVK